MKDSLTDIYKLGYTQNRELSWLRFNERVLAEADDESVPLLERLKFVSIFTSNLDEFFMIRVGSLFDLCEIKGSTVDEKSGLTPKGQLTRIFKAVRPLYEKREKTYFDIERQLRSNGVYDLSYKELSASEQKYVKGYFRTSIAPVLSPQIVDAHHPFPHLQSKVLHAGAIMKLKGREVFGFIPVPSTLAAMVYLPSSEVRCISIENILLEFFDTVFDVYEVEEKTVFCITRNADIAPDEEAYDIDGDYRKKLRKMLAKRRSLPVVRLETTSKIDERLESYLCEKLDIDKSQIFTTRAPLMLSYAFSLASRLPKQTQKELTDPPFVPRLPAHPSAKESVTRYVQRRDLLLSFPYESMEPFLRLIRESSSDPAVVSIKITIYRLASKARLVEYLCAAAENGKDVTALIELRARFDEQNNIDWSERLEEAGVKISYGFADYKVHSKICLITRRERGEIKHITQVGTGNYNEKTAELYTDFSLMSADERLAADAAEFFKNMAIGNLEGVYSHLLVAPSGLKSSVLALIEQQTKLGRGGRIVFKLNSITDVEIIDALMRASCAGVRIMLFVRGICCILPGVKNRTENITVMNVVGRFLEHSRVYCFGSDNDCAVYISSADFMTRNTERRVEVACPIYDSEVRERIIRYLETMMSDNVKARLLDSSGKYKRVRDSRLPPPQARTGGSAHCLHGSPSAFCAEASAGIRETVRYSAHSMTESACACIGRKYPNIT